MPGKLILCATPIGNLGDVSRRLADTVAAADVVYAEDTRRSKILLDFLGPPKPLRSYFAGNEAVKAEELRQELEAGNTVVLLTDAGTPSIADPGLSAVREARKAGAQVSIIPGPSALTAAIAVSGLPSERFVFEGFLPRRGKERQARLNALASETRTTVMFVGATHLLVDIEALAKVAPDREICVARELTKAFEEVRWSTCSDAVDQWRARPIKGEFTLVIAGAEPARPGLETAIEEVLREVAKGGQMASVVRAVASEHGLSRRQLYEAVLARTPDRSPEQ